MQEYRCITRLVAHVGLMEVGGGGIYRDALQSSFKKPRDSLTGSSKTAHAVGVGSLVVFCS